MDNQIPILLATSGLLDLGAFRRNNEIRLPQLPAVCEGRWWRLLLGYAFWCSPVNPLVNQLNFGLGKSSLSSNRGSRMIR